jgi:hypothetical protein
MNQSRKLSRCAIYTRKSTERILLSKQSDRPGKAVSARRYKKLDINERVSRINENRAPPAKRCSCGA